MHLAARLVMLVRPINKARYCQLALQVVRRQFTKLSEQMGKVAMGVRERLGIYFMRFPSYFRRLRVVGCCVKAYTLHLDFRPRHMTAAFGQVQ